MLLGSDELVMLSIVVASTCRYFSWLALAKIFCQVTTGHNKFSSKKYEPTTSSHVLSTVQSGNTEVTYSLL